MKKISLIFAIFALSLLADFALSGESHFQTQGHFISSLNAKVSKLRFFESPNDAAVPYEQRDHRTEFPKSSTRYVWWELGLEYPIGSPRTDFEVLAIYYKPDGSIFGRYIAGNFYIDPALTSVAYSSGRGWGDPGKWPPGTYEVDLFIEGQKVASGSFKIYSSGKEPVKQYVPPEKEKPLEDIEIPDDLGEL